VKCLYLNYFVSAPVYQWKRLLPTFVVVLVNIFIVELQERDMTFAAEQDVEYELEEVWDGAQWHVVHKLLPKKTDSGSV